MAELNRTTNTGPTQLVEASNGIRYAYRRFGAVKGNALAASAALSWRHGHLGSGVARCAWPGAADHAGRQSESQLDQRRHAFDHRRNGA